MRALRILCLTIIAFQFPLLVSAQQTYSGASVGDDGSINNLCAHGEEKNSASTKATCGGTLSDPEHHYSGAGSAAAEATFSLIAIGGSVEVSNDLQGNEAQMGVSAQADMSDYFTVQGYSGEAYFLTSWSLIAAPDGTAYSGVSESVTLEAGSKGGTCQIEVFGTNSCSAMVQLTPGENVYLSVILGGTAQVSCTPPGCGGAAAGFNAGIGSPGGGSPLIVAIVDANGDLIPGVTITTGSRHKYPTKYRSTTSLTSSANPSTAGESVTLMATVSSLGRNNAPTGKVTFKDATTGTRLGSATLSAGVASITISSLPVGTDAISATYAGDNWSSASKPATLDQVVN